MRLTAQDLKQLGVVDQIIPEPIGGAHRNPGAVIAALGDALEASLEPLLALDGKQLRHKRRQKFLNMGQNGTI
jgi:acetyl-CoA carboxylase carboxyl transferase subunit alpha